MASRLNPYIQFKDSARPALEFYRDVFGGEVALSTFGEFGMSEGADAELIMHGQIETSSGYTLMAADTPAHMEYNAQNGSTTISLSGDDADDLRGYFGKLSEGGAVTVPLEKQVWGDEFGMCVDKFGVPWMVNITQSQG